MHTQRRSAAQWSKRMPDDRTVLKVGVGVSFVIAAATLLYTHEVGSLYPGLPVGALFAVTTLFVCAVVSCRGDSHPSYTLLAAPFTLLTVGYRVYVFSFPASLVGIDPARYAVQVGRVMSTGGTGAIGFTYYSHVSLSITYPAIYGLLAGISPADSLLVYPIVLGALTPLTTVGFVTRVSRRSTAINVVVALTLAAVAAVSIRFSYWPIAQTLGLLYWFVFGYLLIRYYQTRSKRTFLLLVGVLLALTFTHKLPLLVIFGVLLELTFWSTGRQLYQRIRSSGRRLLIREPNALLIGLITGTLMMVQWTYVTEFIEVVVVRAVSVLVVDAVPASAGQTGGLPTDAAVAEPGSGPIGLFFRRGHGIALLIVGGLTWAYLFFSRRVERRQGLKVLLVLVTVPVLLLGFGIVAQSQSGSTAAPSPNRFVSFAEPVLIALIALVAGRAIDRVPQSSESSGWATVGSLRSKARAVFFALFVLALVSTQLFSAPATPDHPSSTRYYLTSQEADAKAFGYDHVPQQIHTDWYASIAGPPSGQLSGEFERYNAIGEPLLYQNVTQQGYEYVLYRSDVWYYATEYGPKQLLWNPGERLDGEYNRVYSNGGAVLYDRSEARGGGGYRSVAHPG